MSEGRQRRSNMRASIATILHRHGLPAEVIDQVFNESYEHFCYCKTNDLDVYEIFQRETGMTRI